MGFVGYHKWGFRSDVVFLRSAEGMPLRPVHRLDKPAGYIGLAPNG